MEPFYIQDLLEMKYFEKENKKKSKEDVRAPSTLTLQDYIKMGSDNSQENEEAAKKLQQF